MSAFIVGNDCITRIVKKAVSLSFSNESHLVQDIKAAGFDLKDDEQVPRFAQKLLDMNIAAVDQRYSEKNPKRKFKFDPSVGLAFSLVGFYKSLQCLLYQCSEGTIPRRKLFKALESVGNSVAAHIVGGLPEYEAAKWG